jgi:thioredoxin 1
MSTITKLNERSYESSTASGTVVVKFGADWCGPCKRLLPNIEKLAHERTDVSVCEVDIDECGDLAKKLGVRSIPVTVVYKDGVEKKRTVGLTTYEGLCKMVDD